MKTASLVVLLAVGLSACVGKQTTTVAQSPQVFKVENCTSGTNDIAVCAPHWAQTAIKPANASSLVPNKAATLMVYPFATKAFSGTVRYTIAAPGLSTITNDLNAAYIQGSETTNTTAGVAIAVPASYAVSGVSVAVTLDPDGAFGDTVASNNTLTVKPTFANAARINVMYVPVATSNTTAPAVPANIAEKFKTMFPITEVVTSTHVAYTFDGTLNSGDQWETLLAQMAELKKTEQPNTNTHYVALVKSSSSNAGIAYIGSPIAYASVISVSTAFGQDVFAHELGHNLSLSHAPCNATKDLDPNYPYAGGLIGQDGYDASTGTLHKAAVARDVMGYCFSNAWLSQYNYSIVQNVVKNNPSKFALASGVSAMALQPQLSISGTMGNSQANIELVLPATGVSECAQYGAYTLELPSGQRCSFDTVKAVLEPSGQTTEHFSVTLPVQSLEGVVLRKNGKVINLFRSSTFSAQAANVQAAQVKLDQGRLTWPEGLAASVKHVPTGQMLTLGSKAGVLDVTLEGELLVIIDNQGSFERYTVNVP